jgi:phosphopantothenoylcysteine synthetase/decarboxylase
MAAAVSDYTPVRVSRTKIKRSKKPLTIELKPTVDILKWAGEKKIKNKILVGFALEDKNIKTKAEKKLKEKNLALIIANKPSAIGEDCSSLLIKTPPTLPLGRKRRGWLAFQKEPKKLLAEKIIRLIEKLFRHKSGGKD